MSNTPKSLIDKLQAVPEERLAEVEDFVDFIALRAQDRSLVRAASAVSAAAFEKVWSNPDDGAYDAL